MQRLFWVNTISACASRKYANGVATGMDCARSNIHPAAMKWLHLQHFADVFTFCAARAERHRSGKNFAARLVSPN
jgi:hypothetical protein